MKSAVRILFLFLNVLLALALLLCLTTRFFNPQSFPYIEVLALGFPIIFGLNCITSVFWIVSKEHKKYCIVSLIALLVSIPMICNYYVFGKKEPVKTTNNSLKIMSYNVMGFMYFTWRKSTEVKQQIFLHILKENPDIICFQEYHNDTNEKFIVLDSLKQQLNLSYVYHNKLFSVGDNHFQGNLICSRYPIVNVGKMDYEKTGNSAIWVDVAIGSDTIRIYNSHLESYRLSQENKQTVNEIRAAQNVEVAQVENIIVKLKNSIQKRGSQVEELARSMEECPYPIISCGDFNSLPCSYSYQRIKSVRNFTDAFLECGHGVGATFNWWPQLRLDYILVDPKFDCCKFKRTGLKVSDHFPICCEIDIQPSK
ncbi:MAG: endonuclease/exonuclease/phosphatase family protein [Bacteroidales bacterium]|nr:endonuclease/exonuclease/phosphatase family protein [Bacteroidales bacterium]